MKHKNSHKVIDGDIAPFFSIIIPTRNRSELVAYAIESVLNQSFKDYELIISDNSDVPLVSDDESKLRPNWFYAPNVRYIYTKNVMYLPDHFDFATRLARGKYIATLTDRFVMLPSALEVLHKVIGDDESSEPDLVVWNMQSNYSDVTRIQTVAKCTGNAELINTNEMLADFVKFSGWMGGEFYFSKLPRGLNSIYKRKLSEVLIEKYGRVFRPFSPDYASAFLFLAHTDEVVYVDLPLYMSHGNKSTGNRSNLYGLQTFASEVNPIENCPLPLGTVFNTVVRDFIATKDLVHPLLQGIDICIVGYYLSNYAEFIVKESMGSPLDLRPFYKVFNQGLDDLTIEQKNEILLGMKALDIRRPSSFNIKKQKFIRKFGLSSLRDFLRALQVRYKHQKMGGLLYSNIFEATSYSDHLLRKFINN